MLSRRNFHEYKTVPQPARSLASHSGQGLPEVPSQSESCGYAMFKFWRSSRKWLIVKICNHLFMITEYFHLHDTNMQLYCKNQGQAPEMYGFYCQKPFILRWTYTCNMLLRCVICQKIKHHQCQTDRLFLSCFQNVRFVNNPNIFYFGQIKQFIGANSAPCI